MQKLKDLNMFLKIAICFVLVFAAVWMIVFGISSLIKTGSDFKYEGIIREN